MIFPSLATEKVEISSEGRTSEEGKKTAWEDCVHAIIKSNFFAA